MGFHQRGSLPIDQGRILIDGRPLGHYPVWIVDDGIEIDESELAVSMTDMPGAISVDQTLEDASGAAIAGRRTVTLHLATTGEEEEAVEALIRLGEHKGRIIDLTLPPLPGVYRGRCDIGAPTIQRAHGVYDKTLIDLSVDADPILYAPKITKPITEGENKLGVRGNRITHPKFTLTPKEGAAEITVSDATRTLTYRPDGGAFAPGATLAIDCEPNRQSSTLGDNPMPPTMDSIYPVLTPKQTTITVTGATGTVTWEPRYYI